VRIGILFTRGKHLYARIRVTIISLLGEVWADKTSLATSCVIEESVPSQECKSRGHIFVC